MTRGQQDFVYGGARAWLVMALMVTGVSGAGYLGQKISIGEADYRAAERDRYEDLMKAYTDLSRQCGGEANMRGQGGGR